MFQCQESFAVSRRRSARRWPQELRFVFPALPLLNLAAGVGMSRALRGVWGGGAGGKDDDGDGDGQGDAGGAAGEGCKRSGKR